MFLDFVAKIIKRYEPIIIPARFFNNIRLCPIKSNYSANLLKILFFHTDLKDLKDCYAAKRLRIIASPRSEQRSHLYNLSNPCEIYSLNCYHKKRLQHRYQRFCMKASICL